MFNPSDVYVEGGNSDLLVCWTDKVTKYDASSFYNWEMDNLPLHDLDERTHLLWERVGHPTSSITGMSFVVSGDLKEDTCSPFFFKSLSSCMAALPDVINYPILIEVVSFGDLGSLEIPAKTFGPRGKIEIINRNSSFAGAISLSGGPMSIQTLSQSNAEHPDSVYGIASGVQPGGFAENGIAKNNVSGPALSIDLFRGKTFTGDHFVASSTGRPWSDQRFFHDSTSAPRAGSYVYTRRVYADGDNRMTAALRSKKHPWNSAATNVKDVSGFAFDAFDGNVDLRKTNDPTMDTFDVSTFSYLSDSEISWGNHASANLDAYKAQTKTQGAAAFAYFNYLQKIKVHDCNGPVFIRNFTVDCQHDFNKGIDIKNSNVLLERCSVARANKAGLHVENSHVDLVRGFVAYRNYELLGSTRTGIPFAEKRVAYQSASSYGAGIYAINSTVNVSSTYDRDILQTTNATGAFNAYPDYSGDVPAPSMEALYCLSRNDIGIHAVNSQIIGGRTELNGSATPSLRWLDATQVFSELNTEAGVKLENSQLINSGRFLLYGNYRGLEADNSKIETDVIKCKDNQAEGIILNNSQFIYGKDLYANITRSNQFSEKLYRFDQVGLIDNGTHLKASNSIIKPVATSALPSFYSQFFTSGAFQTNNAGTTISLKGVNPSIELSNNSKAELLHFVGNRRNDFRADSAGDRAVYGSVIKVDKNSSVVTRGSEDFATVIAGPNGRANHISQAGVYCNDNSVASFQGPTVIGSLGVDVLADNNSRMEFVPHRDNDGELLVSSFDLTNTANHTTVELHSTRACLVANNNSEITMQDLGDYKLRYANDLSVHGETLITLNKFDYLNDGDQFSNDSTYRSNVRGGYIQFYPNAFTDDQIFDEGLDLNSLAGQGASRWATIFDKNNFTTYGASIISGVDNFYLQQLSIPTFEDIDNLSCGGMCVRALNGSKVNVTNVHFPAGWHNTSGFVYDLSGNKPNCTRLRIWNIADDSTLDANYVSVSGIHPFDSVYHGPRGIWKDNDGDAVSSAPSGTPDTSSISILDYYGRSDTHDEQAAGGTPLNPFGFNSHQNRGPFRLFFSIDPAANWLQPSAVSAVGAQPGPDVTQQGVIRQLFSQGYQPSSTAIANNTVEFNASSEYVSLLRREFPNVSGLGTLAPIHASGFYYANEFVYNPQTIKATLDESGGSLFANAKHNTVGKSNLAKVVNIYFPYIDYPVGGDSYGETTLRGARGVASFNNFDLEKNN